jgi:glucosamine 6-phosphate synthetase-like amidotransferase/phosphosugar isomerase protein
MCGIVAVICKKDAGFYQKDIAVFEQLLDVGHLRGDDATGVITVLKNTDFYIDKDSGTSQWFLYSFDSLESRKEALKTGYALIGHNRYGTIGKKDDAQNAHPFLVEDHFAMVHNGSLTNHKTLADTTVDSEALSIVIEKAMNGDSAKPKTEALESILSDVYGAYACVWYNQADHTIGFVRNSQRPLWYVETDDNYYLASEAGMLAWILSRNGISPKELHEVKVDHLYTIDLDEFKHPMTVEPLTIKKYTPSTTSTGTSGEGTNIIKTNHTLSKNYLKRFLKENKGKYVDFYVYDYTETTIGDPNCSKYLIQGQTDLWSWEHCINVIVDAKKLGIDDFAIRLDDIYFRGDIESLQFNKTTNEVDVWLDPDSITIVQPKLTLKNAHAYKIASTDTH